MTVLRYKEYQGSVEYEDGTLLIRILHIDDLITTTADSAAAAQTAFEELVNDYLATCEELGKEPSKPFKGSFNVRVSPILHRRVAMAAAEVGETMNAWIASALQSRVDAQQMKKAVLESSLAIEIFDRPPADRGYAAVKTLEQSANPVVYDVLPIGLSSRIADVRNLYRGQFQRRPPYRRSMRHSA